MMIYWMTWIFQVIKSVSVGEGSIKICTSLQNVYFDTHLVVVAGGSNMISECYNGKKKTITTNKYYKFTLIN